MSRTRKNILFVANIILNYQIDNRHENDQKKFLVIHFYYHVNIKENTAMIFVYLWQMFSYSNLPRKVWLFIPIILFELCLSPKFRL